MTTYYVATLARYVLVDADDEKEVRAKGRAALHEMYADVRERHGREVPIDIRTVRHATDDEVRLRDAKAILDHLFYNRLMFRVRHGSCGGTVGRPLTDTNIVLSQPEEIAMTTAIEEMERHVGWENIRFAWHDDHDDHTYTVVATVIGVTDDGRWMACNPDWEMVWYVRPEDADITEEECTPVPAAWRDA